MAGGREKEAPYSQRTFPAAADEAMQTIGATTLDALDIGGNCLPPSEISRLANHFKGLRILFASHAAEPLGDWPETAKLSAGLRTFGAKNSGLTSIADGVLPESLQWLILTGNEMRELPTSGPPGAGRYGPELVKVALSGNRLRSLPPSIRYWRRVELLRLGGRGNAIENPPPALWSLPRLAFLGIGAKNFKLGDEARKAADELRSEREGSLPELPAETGAVVVQKRLGSGASGTGFLVSFTGEGGGSTSAVVKRFHALTGTDGDSEDEYRAQMALDCDDIVRAVATMPRMRSIVGHDGGSDGSRSRSALGGGAQRLRSHLGQGKRAKREPVVESTPESTLDVATDIGTVLEAVGDVQSVADPPSLLTISRDQYGTRREDEDGDSSYAIGQNLWRLPKRRGDGLLEVEVRAGEREERARVVLSALLSIARAGAYLHGNHGHQGQSADDPAATAARLPPSLSPRVGLAHGDLYAHNILVGTVTREGRRQRRVLLSDFGSSFFYSKEGERAEVASSIQGIEVRAWAILAAEMLGRMGVRLGASDDSASSSSTSSSDKNPLASEDVGVVSAAATTIAGAGLPKKLLPLVLRCLRPKVPATRPRFAQIAAELVEMGAKDF